MTSIGPLYTDLVYQIACLDVRAYNRLVRLNKSFKRLVTPSLHYHRDLKLSAYEIKRYLIESGKHKKKYLDFSRDPLNIFATLSYMLSPVSPESWIWCSIHSFYRKPHTLQENELEDAITDILDLGYFLESIDAYKVYSRRLSMINYAGSDYLRLTLLKYMPELQPRYWELLGNYYTNDIFDFNEAVDYLGSTLRVLCRRIIDRKVKVKNVVEGLKLLYKTDDLSQIPSLEHLLPWLSWLTQNTRNSY